MTIVNKLRYLYDLDEDINMCNFKRGDIILTRYNHKFGTSYIKYKDMDYRFYSDETTYPKIENFEAEIIEITSVINSLYRKKKIKKLIEDYEK